MVLDNHQISQAVELAHVASPFVTAAATLPNLSIAMTWCRIFTPSKLEHILLHGVPSLQALILFSACLLSIFQCIPTRALWDPSVQGKCLPLSTILDFWFFNAGQSDMTWSHL